MVVVFLPWCLWVLIIEAEGQAKEIFPFHKKTHVINMKDKY